MKSMIFHANVRANDPVGGCHRIIRELEQQIQHYEAELEVVLRQLAVCRVENVVNEMQNPNSVVGLSDYYGHRPIQDPLGFDDVQRSGAIKVDMQASSSSSSTVMNNGKQIFVGESEYIKPQQPILFESDESIELFRKFKRL
ncbi:LOB domain-containing protein 22 [Camellia lanceoleosa]|uniref:LOB domain-containing protein 22 n=1 Tax=Camellia lanceoleosa TaxID=1840588 RepID=A0ACC0G0N4_9ERIC|nr:LOB domain-containing protein 22 [Camellia lanceoleosa]